MVQNNQKTTAPIIVIIDDDETLLSGLKRQLRNFDAEVHYFDSGEEALSYIKTHQPTIVVSDYLMTGIKGSELLVRVKEQSPNSIRILMTGLTDMEVAVESVNSGHIHKMILKPFSVSSLLKLFERAIIEQKLLCNTKRIVQTLRHGESSPSSARSSASGEPPASRIYLIEDENVNLEDLCKDVADQIDQLE